MDRWLGSLKTSAFLFFIILCTLLPAPRQRLKVLLLWIYMRVEGRGIEVGCVLRGHAHTHTHTHGYSVVKLADGN